MTHNKENNKRIVKNTMMLYFRMLFVIMISLYTSRIVLSTLGVEDFGIFNVVGGIVILFSFLNNAMAVSVQRFFAFELGKKDYKQLNKVFSVSINIFLIIALVVFILAETLGYWFLKSQLVIPFERMSAAVWMYQFSILSFIIVIVGIPYNALIISHEKMAFFAYIGILEAILKLLIVFLLQYIDFDRLKMYAVFSFGVVFLIRLFYYLYCMKKFEESRYRFIWDKSLFRSLTIYTGWNLWGNISSVTSNQGVNLLLNMFYGPKVNAARGVAYQLNGALNGFVANFQTAMNPQIIKSYASGDNDHMHQLVIRGAKYSFFLLFIVSLPVLIDTETVFVWWLNTVPAYTVVFGRLIFIIALIDCISVPLGTAAQATGKIKKYQFLIGLLQILILPISYLYLKLGYFPQIVFYVAICISILSLFARVCIIAPLIKLSIYQFVKQVLFQIFLVVVISTFFSIIASFLIPYDGFLKFLIVCFVSTLLVLFFVYWIGISKVERDFVRVKFSELIGKINNICND